MGMLVTQIFMAASILLVIGVVTPFFLVILLPLGYFYRQVQQYYLQSSRELKRLDNISKSPIFAQFSETLSGLATIRPYNRQADFLAENNRKLDLNSMAYYVLSVANRWLGVRLEFMGTLVVTLAASLAVIEKSSLGPGFAGLSVGYALQLTGTLNWLVRQATEAETQMVSVERCLEYTKLETEAPPIIRSNRPPKDWPQEGHIELKDVQLRYREGLDLVLRGVTLDIKAQQKIGVVAAQVLASHL